MSNKRKIVLCIIGALLLAASLCTFLIAKKASDLGLLYIRPIPPNSSEINAERLEELNGETFLLTYEIRENGRITVFNASYDVTAVMTNYTYNFIMKYPVVSGSFFTEKAQEQMQNVMTLNKKAADTLLGSTDIHDIKVTYNRDEYIILGVIDDYDSENCNVYLPAACFARNPDSLIAQMDGSDSKLRIINECKALGISADRYDFALSGESAEFVHRFVLLALKLAFICLLLFLTVHVYRICKKKIIGLRERLKSTYIRDMFKNDRKEILWLIAIAVALLAVFMLLIYSSSEFFTDILILKGEIS